MNKITLSLPPRLNSLYKVTRSGIFYKSSEAKQWEKDCGWLVKKFVPKTPLIGKLYMEIEMFLKRDRDIDSSLKTTLDFFERMGFYENDSQITHLEVKKFIDKKNPRVEVYIKEL